MKHVKCLAGESESVEPQQGVFRQLLRLLWEHESEAIAWANTLPALRWGKRNTAVAPGNSKAKLTHDSLLTPRLKICVQTLDLYF